MVRVSCLHVGEASPQEKQDVWAMPTLREHTLNSWQGMGWLLAIVNSSAALII